MYPKENKEGHGIEPWPSVVLVERVELIDVLNSVVNVKLARRGG